MRAQDRRMWTGRRVAVLGALAGALLLLAAAGPSPAQAAPGDLDLGFSSDGKKTTNFAAPGLSSASATVRQPDGKIVAVGADRGHGSADFALARYNLDGSLDTSFSGNGKQTTDFGGGDRRRTGWRSRETARSWSRAARPRPGRATSPSPATTRTGR